MRATKEHFLTLLNMELEDMKHDLEALRQHAAAQQQERAISDRVFRENMAVYENLSAAVDCLSTSLAHVNLDEYEDIPALTEGIEAKCRARLVELGHASGMAGTLKRKMEKIARYLQGDVK